MICLKGGCRAAEVDDGKIRALTDARQTSSPRLSFRAPVDTVLSRMVSTSGSENSGSSETTWAINDSRESTWASLGQPSTKTCENTATLSKNLRRAALRLFCFVGRIPRESANDWFSGFTIVFLACRSQARGSKDRASSNDGISAPAWETSARIQRSFLPRRREPSACLIDSSTD